MSRQPGQVTGYAVSSAALANQLLRFHAERSGDLLDCHITQFVTWSEWEQHIAMTIVPKLQVFVLAGHDLIAVAFENRRISRARTGDRANPFSFPIGLY